MQLNVETSRSAIVDREDCDRMRLLGTELDGTGYQPKSSSVAVLSGIHIHEGFAHLLTPDVDHYSETRLDEAVEIMLDGYTKAFEEHGVRQGEGEDVERILREQRFMLEVSLRGWRKVRMATLLADYRVVSVERAWRWELAPGIVLPFRMDAILRRNDDDLLHVVDFKGTSTGDDTWNAQHEDSRQTILYLTALEEYTGEHVGGILYEGIVRGQFKKDTAQKSPFFGQRIQQTPMVYGYRLLGQDGVNAWRPDYTALKGWVKTPAWEEHTSAEWVEYLASVGTLQKLFAAGTPVNPPPAFRQSIRRQIAHKERDFFIGLARFNELRALHGSDEHPDVQEHLEIWAPQNTGRCNKYGADHKCPFRAGALCFLSNATEILPEEAGFMPRIPHHAPAEIV